MVTVVRGDNWRSVPLLRVVLTDSTDWGICCWIIPKRRTERVRGQSRTWCCKVALLLNDIERGRERVQLESTSDRRISLEGCHFFRGLKIATPIDRL